MKVCGAEADEDVLEGNVAPCRPIARLISVIGIRLFSRSAPGFNPTTFSSRTSTPTRTHQISQEQIRNISSLRAAPRYSGTIGGCNRQSVLLPAQGYHHTVSSSMCRGLAESNHVLSRSTPLPWCSEWKGNRCASDAAALSRSMRCCLQAGNTMESSSTLQNVRPLAVFVRWSGRPPRNGPCAGIILRGTTASACTSPRS